MRESIGLQKEWHVSVSAGDAELAAREGGFSPAELQLHDDPQNYPQLIDLPGGPEYGKRPRHGAGEATVVAPADSAFVGPTGAGASERLPAPFLSYAQLVEIPAEWAGQTIFLHLDMVRYHVTAQLNGHQVAHYLGGLEPHRRDVTAAVTPGEAALLLITVGDSGVSGKRNFDPYGYTGTRLPTCQEIENCLVHPVNYGGSDRAVGSVRLEAVPPRRTEYVFANPQVARGVLQFTAVLANDTDQPAEVHVRSEAGEDKLLLDEDVVIPPRGRAEVYREVPWADARLWDVDDPWLYELRTTLVPLPCQGRGQGVRLPSTSTRTISAFANSPLTALISSSTAKKFTSTATPATSRRRSTTCRWRRRLSFCACGRKRGISSTCGCMRGRRIRAGWRPPTGWGCC